jgi:FkbM family methyltransferase
VNPFEFATEPAIVPNYHNGQDATFYCYEKDFISAYLKNGRVWEPHMHTVFEDNISPTDVVLDIGANIGTHSVKMAKLAKRLLAFEPLRPSYDLLKQNLRANGCSNAIAYEYALSDDIYSTAYDFVGTGNLGGSGLLNEHLTPTTESIDAITLDSLYLNQVDFIKVDVEGYEPKVILGGLETIKAHHPTIVLECWDTYPNVSRAHTEKEHWILLSLGYEISQVSNCDWMFTYAEKK